MEIDVIHIGDARMILKSLPDTTIDCVITSPPYWGLRDYGVEGQIGMEESFEQFIAALCEIFDEIKRILKPEGTCWVNLGDTYISKGIGRHDGYPDPKHPHGRIGRSFEPNALPQSLPEKCLAQIPNRFAIEMCNHGWWLRNEIIWHKPNVMPESATDRFTNDFEKLFLFTKQKTYFFQQQFEPAQNWGTRDRSKFRGGTTDPKLKHHGFTNCNFAETGRNKRAVWSIPTKPQTEAHFATYPEKLIAIPMKAGCPEGGIVLDPFMGTGTTALMAKKLGRRYVGIELNEDYYKISQRRLSQQFLF